MTVLPSGQNRKYAFFPGCLISSRFPHFESSTITVLKKFGIELELLKGVTCCPEFTSLQVLNAKAWYTIAARNVCLAERRKLDLLTICSGCNATLFRVNEDLKRDNDLRMRVNENLEKVGKKFNGNVVVKSLLRVLYEDVGPMKIRDSVKTPLRGINVAVHYGCHIFDELKNYDDAKEPKSLQILVEALGANIVTYPSEKLCCGSHIAGCIDKDFSYELIMEKLNDLTNVNADCLVVMCPYCFLQYDVGQFVLSSKFKKQLKIPILYLTQLMGLAMGYGAHDMGLEFHKVNPDSLIRKLKLTS